MGRCAGSGTTHGWTEKLDCRSDHRPLSLSPVSLVWQSVPLWLVSDPCASSVSFEPFIFNVFPVSSSFSSISIAISTVPSDLSGRSDTPETTCISETKRFIAMLAPDKPDPSDLELCHAVDRPDCQLWRKDLLHVWWKRPMSRYFPRTKRCRCWCRCSTLSRLLCLVRFHPRIEGCLPMVRCRPQGFVKGCH